MIDLNQFAQEVHANAVDHGWWGEEYTDAAVIALIHAEISEAFEEWRAGRPMMWYACTEVDPNGNPCDPKDEYDCLNFAVRDTCKYRGKKPEGIAVELIDVALRILDAAAAWGVNVDISKITAIGFGEATLPEIVSYLHSSASEVYDECCGSGLHDPNGIFGEMIAVIFTWLRAHDLDPEPLMREKHNYNQTRPYKHGGKRV